MLKVFVKAVHPSNGRFRLTLDPAITPEKANRMKNAAMRARSRFSMRKQAADLKPGEEILGEIVRASKPSMFEFMLCNAPLMKAEDSPFLPLS